jgi:hypothetical protein
MKNGLEIDAFGNKFWCKNGNYHKEDGPAVEFNDGTKVWYQNGLVHREDGPAVEYGNNESKEWWIEGKIVSKDQFNKLLAKKRIDKINTFTNNGRPNNQNFFP